MNNDLIMDKLKKYDSLLQAIDFFTQKFNLNQLSSYAYALTKDILELESSALFVKTEDGFRLSEVQGYEVDAYCIEDNVKLQRIAAFHGNVMTSGFNIYFEDTDLDFFQPRIIIPFIIKDLLYGFIISKGKKDTIFSYDDLQMSKALMQLINNALESSKNFMDLLQTNQQLDQKIFNLFSINHSSRMLLSELDLNKLYSLAIDIFSELTSSRITSFGLYDDITDKVVLRGYRDVFCCERLQMDFELADSSYTGYKVVFHYQRDREQLQSIFRNYEDFKRLSAEYIILIVKEKVLGFVTISMPVNDRAYDQALFELIESLAASTYSSFKNAIYFNEIERQKNTIHQKLQALTKLNRLIRNINSCESVGELCDIAMKTLQHSFGIKKTFIALLQGEEYEIKNHVGFDLKNTLLPIPEEWEEMIQETFVSYTAQAAEAYIPKPLLNEIGALNCLIISPISMNKHAWEEEQKPLGYMVVLHTPESLKEEEVLLIETLSNSIAPVISHLHESEQIKKNYIRNQREWFIHSLDSKLISKNKYFIDFYIYYKKIAPIPFQNIDLSSYGRYEHFYFDNLLLVLSFDKLAEDEFDGVIEADSKEAAIEKLQTAFFSKD